MGSQRGLHWVDRAVVLLVLGARSQVARQPVRLLFQSCEDDNGFIDKSRRCAKARRCDAMRLICARECGGRVRTLSGTGGWRVSYGQIAAAKLDFTDYSPAGGWATRNTTSSSSLSLHISSSFDPLCPSRGSMLCVCVNYMHLNILRLCDWTTCHCSATGVASSGLPAHHRVELRDVGDAIFGRWRRAAFMFEFDK